MGNGTVYAAEEKENEGNELEPVHKPPVKKFKCGPVVAAVWEKEITITDRMDGKKKTIALQSVSFQRRYRDRKTGEWKNSTSYPTDNLADLIMLAHRCAEWIKLKDITDGSKDFDNSGNY